MYHVMTSILAPTASRVGILLVVLGSVVCGAGRTVEAATSKPITGTITCVDTCSQNRVSCNAGCCFLFICKKSCVQDCGVAEVTCLDGCLDSSGAFFDTAVVADDGRAIHVGGPFACPKGATADVSVTLTQDGTGAVASGTTRLRCPDGDTAFGIEAHAVGGSRFRPATAAQACAVAQVHALGRSIASFQWCRDVTLLPEGVELEE
jgi:hypothetical protein